jgi:uncharacterized protein YqeY
MIEIYVPETMIDERIREAERKAAQSGGGRGKRMPSAMTHSKFRLQGELQILVASSQRTNNLVQRQHLVAIITICIVKRQFKL